MQYRNPWQCLIYRAWHSSTCSSSTKGDAPSFSLAATCFIFSCFLIHENHSTGSHLICTEVHYKSHTSFKKKLLDFWFQKTKTYFQNIYQNICYCHIPLAHTSHQCLRASFYCFIMSLYWVWKWDLYTVLHHTDLLISLRIQVESGIWLPLQDWSFKFQVLGTEDIFLLETMKPWTFEKCLKYACRNPWFYNSFMMICQWNM